MAFMQGFDSALGSLVDVVRRSSISLTVSMDFLCWIGSILVSIRGGHVVVRTCPQTTHTHPHTHTRTRTHTRTHTRTRIHLYYIRVHSTCGFNRPVYKRVYL